MLSIEIHQIGCFVLSEASLQIGHVVQFRRICDWLRSLYRFLRIVFQLYGRELHQLTFLGVWKKTALGDFQSARAHFVERERRVWFDLLGKEGLAQFEGARFGYFSRVVILAIFLFVAVLTTLFIEKRGIKLLFTHKLLLLLQRETINQIKNKDIDNWR